MKREPDIVVISDVHLGTYGCHAAELLNYLKSIRPRTLVINGDFIDICQFQKNSFPEEHLRVVQRVLKMAAKGTKVYYITGNHDDTLRRYCDLSTGNIHLRNKLILQLRDHRAWIFHGDIFDLPIHYSPLITKIGGKSYSYLIRLNRFVNKTRKLLGLHPMSLAKKVKQQVKKAVSFINDFEQTAIDLAGKQKYDYVICGHIHCPQIRTAQSHGHKVTYLNSGDWVENLSALEYQYGKWQLHHYNQVDYQIINNRLLVNKGSLSEQEESLTFDKGISTEALLKNIFSVVS